MKLLARLLLVLTLCVIARDHTSAASLFEDRTGLLFHIPDPATLRDASADYSVPADQKILEAERTSGENVFEIGISSEALTEVLEDLQLRKINTIRLANRELLGTTGIEITGASFVDNKPRSAFVFALENFTISILYLGQSTAEFEQFLESIEKTSGFGDTISHPLNPEIALAAERNIFSGYREGTSVVFRPNQGINRAEFLKVLVLSGTTDEAVNTFYAKVRTESDFQLLLPDVDRDAWFAPYIFYALDKGWVQGYPDGSFKPGNTINIAEAAKILLESKNRTFPSDAEVWFRPYLDFFIRSQILSQDNDKYRFSFTEQSLFAHENCTRAQAAGFISRLLFLEENPDLEFFGRPVPSEGLDFGIRGAVTLEVFESGMSLSERSHNAYNIYRSSGNKREGLMQVLVYYPEQWTELEKTGALASQNLVYLGENMSLIYATKSICQGELQCVEELKNPFILNDQDLQSFDDPNVGFTFSYNQVLQFEKVLESQLETLVLKREDNSQMMIMSYFKGQTSPFQGQPPLSKYFIGNREWSAYIEVVRGVTRVSLTTSFGSGTMVASIPNLEKVVNMDAKVFRILRTLELR
jgi:hypothetical protein